MTPTWLLFFLGEVCGDIMKARGWVCGCACVCARVCLPDVMLTDERRRMNERYTNTMEQLPYRDIFIYYDNI